MAQADRFERERDVAEHDQHDRQTFQPSQRHDQQQDGSGMQAMAQQIKRHYLAPTPGATKPSPDPFPPAVMRGLGLGAVLGALLGLGIAWLLWRGSLVIPGWEGMFSMGDVTFFVFWTMLGIACGGAVIGIAAILATPVAAPGAEAGTQHEHERRERSPQPSQDGAHQQRHAGHGGSD